MPASIAQTPISTAFSPAELRPPVPLPQAMAGIFLPSDKVMVRTIVLSVKSYE